MFIVTKDLSSPNMEFVKPDGLSPHQRAFACFMAALLPIFCTVAQPDQVVDFTSMAP